MCVPKSIHRSDVMSLTEVFTYDDSAHDYFEREPYCAKFHIFDAGLFHWFIILGKRRIHLGAINIEHLLFAIVVSNYYGRLMCRHLFCIMLQPFKTLDSLAFTQNQLRQKRKWTDLWMYMKQFLKNSKQRCAYSQIIYCERFRLFTLFIENPFD